MTIETKQHTPATRQLMNAVGDDVQRLLRQTLARHCDVDQGENAVMEGFIFGFCAVAFDMRPDHMTGDEVAAMIAQQAARYVAGFQAESLIGRAQGNA